MSATLFSHKTLPRWVWPCSDLPARFSIFCGRLVPGRITEYTFIVDRNGHVRFEAETHHAPHTLAKTDPTPVAHIPPEVLIAAGVEAIRRRKATP